MKEAVYQDHLEYRVGAARGQRLAVEPGGVDAGKIVAADALNVLLHVHHARCPLPIHMRNKDVGIIGEIAREAFHVTGLDREVQLALERAAQLAHHLDRTIEAHLGHFAFHQLSKVAEDSEIGVDFRLDAGAADLQDHRNAAGKPGAVHLRDRGGGVGFALEGVEHLERRAAERRLDLRQQLVERHRRDPAVQPVELGGPGRRQQVLAHREHLAELDEGRPQLLEREPHALLRFEMRDVAAVAPVQDLAGTLEHGRDAGAPHQVAKPMPDQDRADLAQAWQVADRTEHAPHHGRPTCLCSPRTGRATHRRRRPARRWRAAPCARWRRAWFPARTRRPHPYGWRTPP